MKIKICPICGGKKLMFWGDEVECWDCQKEIIPLVTPQEIRDD